MVDSVLPLVYVEYVVSVFQIKFVQNGVAFIPHQMSTLRRLCTKTSDWLRASVPTSVPGEDVVLIATVHLEIEFPHCY